MNKIAQLSSFILCFICISCCEVHGKEFHYTFFKGTRGWEGDFADYPVGEENLFELSWGWSNLPAPISLFSPPLKEGIFLSGNNHSDDLFMFIKKQIKGLHPFTKYDLFFQVTIQNNIPPGQFGIGGSPGESVYFKVGASTIEPEKVGSQFYRLNVDKGEQSQGGKNAMTVGDLANPLVDPNNPTYQPKQFSNAVPLTVRTDCRGRLWLFVGTDSGFEGPTLYYIAQIIVSAVPSRN
jgi:hypothetical protein